MEIADSPQKKQKRDGLKPFTIHQYISVDFDTGQLFSLK
jgi:hypothetical protein